MKDTVVIGWGRMNPVTNGHQLVVDTLKSVARKANADPFLYISHTTGNAKNPLTYEQKIKWVSKAFGDIAVKSSHRNIKDVLREMDGKYDNLIFVVGKDEISGFKAALGHFKLRFKDIKIVSSGERDDNASGPAGISATKLRQFAADGDLKSFASGLPRRIVKDAKKVMADVRKGLGVMTEEVLDEAPRQLKVGDLLKMRRKFKGVNRSKIKRGRKKAERNPSRNIAARSEKIARRHARAAAAERLSGGKTKGDQSLADRVRIGNRINKSQAIQKRIEREAKKTKRLVRKDLIAKRNQKRQHEALEAKADKWNIPLEVLEQVYQRGLDEHQSLNVDHLTPSQYAFARVNSFATGGSALYEDADLLPEDGGAGEMGTKKLKDKYLKDGPHISIEKMYPDSEEPIKETRNLLNLINSIRKHR